MAPGALEQLLSGLSSVMPAALESRVLAGRARNEDAAVVRVPAGRALVQTVDILAPIVNDAFHFGRIAAANALSDVYALGGEPWCAMNIACFPQELAENDPEGVLSAILRGGAEAAVEAGAVIVGGHTVQDDELKFGLSVTGLIDPEHIAENRNLRPGLALVLTKPLGTGILATGVKAGWEGAGESEAALCRWCGRLNRFPGEAIRRFGLPAATDVTGFGLAGHALEMALASGVCVALDMAALPLLPRVLDYANDGLIPAGSYNNRRHCLCSLRRSEGVDDALEMVAFDAQTSGGMLLAVPRDRLEEVRAFLRENGDLDAVVGEVLPAQADGAALWLRN